MREAPLACVQRAIHRHRSAARSCTFSRRRELHRDPYVMVARKLRSPRIQVVDLTHFFCGTRRCYSVVGGALVYKDSNDHVTTVYGRTLAPYLLARVKRLMRSWGG